MKADTIQNIVSEIQTKIQPLLQENPYVIVAIDGRCAAGKTTLAREFQKALPCNVVHMDDFFLSQSERLSKVGGNIDYERFLEEVMLPLKNNTSFSYRPFDCKSQKLIAPIFVEPATITIIEGAYSTHPLLAKYYDLKVFLSISKDEQQNRILKRNGENGLAIFNEKWIPLEEQYFIEYDVQTNCDMQFQTTY